MPLDRRWMLRYIPHQGTMCLLDEVIAWDAGRIRARSDTHRAADHPLRSHGRLGVMCGIEYAAQAMAIHGALLAGASAESPDTETANRPVAGILASLRGLRLHASRLDDVPGDLICSAVRVAGDGNGALYEFDVSSQGRTLIEGRAAVILDASGRMTA